MTEQDVWARQQKSLMSLYGISCSDVCKELGISNSHLSLIFRGKNIRSGTRGGEGSRGGCSRAKVQEAISKLIAEKQKGG